LLLALFILRFIECFCSCHIRRNTMPPLADAITAVETAQSGYNAAAAQTATDQDAAAASQAKADAAKATVSTDQVAQATAATAFNSALDSLIETATAAKIPVVAS
jgi:hypothetical protein